MGNSLYKSLKSKKSSVAVLLLIAIVPVLFFQNCGGAGDMSAFNSATSTQDKIDASPFAYDVNANQITYMSCSYDGSMTSQPNYLSEKAAFFTLKLGAFDNAGLKLSDDFYTYARKNFKDSLGLLSIPKTIEALSTSPQNTDAQLQLSIRSRSAVATTSLHYGNSPKLGFDYANILSVLTEPTIAENLIKNPTTRYNYFTSGFGNQTKLDGALHFERFIDGDNRVLQNIIENEYILGLTYSEGGKSGSSGTLAKSPYSDSKDSKSWSRAYGAGYNLSFSSTDGTTKNVLSSVVEMDLATNTRSSATWTCPQGLRYKIVRKLDANNSESLGYCPDVGPPAPNTAAHLEWQIITRHLNPSYWRINTTARCLVPRVGSCYEETGTQVFDVDYAQTGNCYPNEGSNPLNCLRYVSVCLRN